MSQVLVSGGPTNVFLCSVETNRLACFADAKDGVDYLKNVERSEVQWNCVAWEECPPRCHLGLFDS